MELAAWLTLAVIALAFVLFVTEIVTVDLAALIVLGLLLLLRLVSPQEGISGFANPATITVLCMFILSAGIERTGAVNLLAQRITRVAGDRSFVQLALLLAFVVPVSAFINNTAAVAILIPLAVGLARDAKRPASRLLIPLSFASMLGGLITLIGTSTNILASSVSSSLGHGGFSMFEFALPGLIIAGVGVTYLLTVGRLLTPDRAGGEQQRFGVEDYLAEGRVGATSSVVDRSLGDLDLAGRYGTEVLRIRRGDAALAATPTAVLREGDGLLLHGPRERILELASLEGVEVHGAGNAADVEFYELVVPPHSNLIGRTLLDARFRERHGGTVVAVQKRVRVVHGHRPLAGTPLQAGNVLLVAGTAEDKVRAAASPDLVLVEELGSQRFRREKLVPAVLILAGVVGVAALGWYDILVTSIVGAALMALLGVLNMDELHRAIRWDILFLLAGVIPLGIALQRNGLATTFAEAIAGASADLEPYWILVLLYGATTLLTEVVSNNATVVLMAPVAAAVAVGLGYDPRLFILAVAFAASTSFLSPIGYQTNTMVYGPGGYKFTDYARVGGLLNLILLFLTPYVLMMFFPP